MTKIKYILQLINWHDIKVWAINTFAFTFSFTSAEKWLKLLLLVLSVVYTGVNIVNAIKRKK